MIDLRRAAIYSVLGAIGQALQKWYSASDLASILLASVTTLVFIVLAAVIADYERQRRKRQRRR